MRSVPLKMRRLRGKYHEILRGVIASIPIFVMYYFTGFQGSAQHKLRHYPMRMFAQKLFIPKANA